MLEDGGRYPGRERRLRHYVVSLRGVLFGHCRDPVGAQTGGQPDERRPQPPMHVGHLAIDEPTDEDVVRTAQLL